MLILYFYLFIYLLQETIGAHPNIVDFVGYIHRQSNQASPVDEFFILLEYLPNSLVNYLALKQKETPKKYFTEKQLFEMLLQITEGINHIHTLNPPMSHRDLKLDNVLMKMETYEKKSKSKDKTKVKKKLILKLCDFGSVCDGRPRMWQNDHEKYVLEDEISRFTTPSYRAPEMVDLSRRHPISTKIDIWVCFCVFFVVLFLGVYVCVSFFLLYFASFFFLLRFVI